MPSPNCVRCEGRTFTASLYPLASGTDTYVLVFCTQCGAVAGVVTK